jgi:hypothetical protein
MSPFTFRYQFSRLFASVPWMAFMLLGSYAWMKTQPAHAQAITIQGQVSMNLSGVTIPLPMQPVVISLGNTTTGTTMTDSTGFYSFSTIFPPFSPNSSILVSTSCPNGGSVSNSQSFNPAISTYTMPLTCGAGGGGTTNTMVLVNGALIWGSSPAPAGQFIQFYLAGSLSPVGSTTTGLNGIINDTLNLNLGSGGSGLLIAVAPCNGGSVVRDSAMVSTSSPLALFQLLCSATPGNTITVQGSVSSSAGLPMVAIPVRIFMANTVTLTAYTDSAGFYQATFAAPSAFPGSVITVSALCGGPTGPGTPATGTATYVQGTTSYTVNLSCGAGSARVLTVSGFYLDPSGNALAGQSVQLYHNQFNTPLRTLITSVGGFFTDTLTTSLPNGFVYAQSSCGTVTTPARDTAYYTGSSTVVNLQLQCSPPAGQHRVAGMITGFTSANPMNFDTLSLVVIRIIPVGQGQVGGWTTVDTVYLLDSAGSAYFNLMLPTGRYSLLATLLTGNASQYAPTYFGDTTTWTLADSFNLPGNAISFLVIDLCANQGGSGGGTVGGGVGGNLPRLSGPLQGIQVQLINANGMTPISHRRSVTTGPTGSFVFSNVPFGSYLLRCEHPGMHSTMVPITLSATSPTHSSTTFNAGSNGFTVSTSSVQDLSLSRFQAYPNPVSKGGVITVQFQADLLAGETRQGPNSDRSLLGSLSVVIRDLKGKIAWRQEIGHPYGGPDPGFLSNFDLDLSPSGIEPGIYTLEVRDSRGILNCFRLVVGP